MHSTATRFLKIVVHEPDILFVRFIDKQVKIIEKVKIVDFFKGDAVLQMFKVEFLHEVSEGNKLCVYFPP